MEVKKAKTGGRPGNLMICNQVTWPAVVCVVLTGCPGSGLSGELLPGATGEDEQQYTVILSMDNTTRAADAERNE